MAPTCDICRRVARPGRPLRRFRLEHHNRAAGGIVLCEACWRPLSRRGRRRPNLTAEQLERLFGELAELSPIAAAAALGIPGDVVRTRRSRANRGR